MRCCELSKAKAEQKRTNEKKTYNVICFAKSYVLLSDDPAKDTSMNEKLSCAALFAKLRIAEMVVVEN